MRILYILIFVGLTFTARTQSSSYTISLEGIEDIKLGMKKDELEKAINQTINLPQGIRKGNGMPLDTVHVNYDEIETEIVFIKQYTGANSYVYVIQEIISNSNLLKTKRGVCIGDDKMKIINAYENYTIWLVPGYMVDSYTVKSKTKSTIWVHGDTTDSALIFHLENNKVTGMTVCYYEKGVNDQ